MHRMLQRRGSGTASPAARVVALLLLAGALLPAVLPADARERRNGRGPTLEPVPAFVLEIFTLQPEECPLDYVPLTDTNRLARLGLSTNPGPLVQPYEAKALAERGVRVALGAAYGRAEEPLLVLNALRFAEADVLQAFLAFQSKLAGRIVCFEQSDETGHWLIMWALDHRRIYDPAEVKAIVDALNAHADRRGLRALGTLITLQPDPL